MVAAYIFSLSRALIPLGTFAVSFLLIKRGWRMTDAPEDSVAGRGLLILLLGLVLAFSCLWFMFNVEVSEHQIAAVFGVELDQETLRTVRRHILLACRIYAIALMSYLSLTELRKRNVFSGVLFLAVAVINCLSLF